MTDPIADMLTRIRNASAAQKGEIILPMSKIKYEIAKNLQQEGWILETEVIKPAAAKNRTGSFDSLKLVLKYKKSGKPFITSIKRVSRPGLRIYAKKGQLPRVLNNFGIAILSTPQGLMTNKSARKEGLGGEVLCEVY